MPPQDALEAIFEQIAEIYVKLCETTVISLSISTASRLLSDNGNFLSQSVAFNNLNTEPNPDIQSIISQQVTNFSAYLTTQVLAKRALLPPAQQGFSDCKVLKICSKSNTINGLWTGVQNVAATPQEISANLAAAITAIKILLDRNPTENRLVAIKTDNPLFSVSGAAQAQEITYNNFETEADTDIEALITIKIDQFEVFIRQLIETRRLTLPIADRSRSDCFILGVCGQVDTINAIWLRFQNLASKPQELGVLVAEAIEEIKKIFAEGDNADPILPFEAPIIWTDKGRLNVDPNSYPFIFENPNNDPEIEAISADFNGVLGDFLNAINVALGGETSPVNTQ